MYIQEAHVESIRSAATDSTYWRNLFRAAAAGRDDPCRFIIKFSIGIRHSSISERLPGVVSASVIITNIIIHRRNIYDVPINTAYTYIVLLVVYNNIITSG